MVRIPPPPPVSLRNSLGSQLACGNLDVRPQSHGIFQAYFRSVRRESAAIVTLISAVRNGGSTAPNDYQRRIRTATCPKRYDLRLRTILTARSLTGSTYKMRPCLWAAARISRSWFWSLGRMFRVACGGPQRPEDTTPLSLPYQFDLIRDAAA
jgi:hypothetical protein